MFSSVTFVLIKNQGMIDRKLEPLIKRLMTKYLGELDDDDLVMFVVEHLKDHKGPQKLVEGLEPVSRNFDAHPIRLLIQHFSGA